MNIIFRSYLYDFLYIIADQLIKKYNPCQIHEDESEELHCMGNEPCCWECRFLRLDGCTTKCLGCKLWLCGAAGEDHTELCKILSEMRTIAHKYNMLGVRKSKKEVFNCMKQYDSIKLRKNVRV